MSDTTDTGGPAMPTDHDYNCEHGMFVPSAGMTLLDYFAGRALLTIAIPSHADKQVLKAHYESVALTCYDIAAVMVAEKRRREGE